MGRRGELRHGARANRGPLSVAKFARAPLAGACGSLGIIMVSRAAVAGLMLALCLLATALTPPQCVTCDSLAQDTCEGTMTSSGGCTWDAAAAACKLSGAALPDGSMGITSLPGSEAGDTVGE